MNRADNADQNDNLFINGNYKSNDYVLSSLKKKKVMSFVLINTLTANSSNRIHIITHQFRPQAKNTPFNPLF